ncbi:MAG: histidine kinase, partial [Marinobacter sp.]|nr:histidine kinase [Marinobacter sp.]
MALAARLEGFLTRNGIAYRELAIDQVLNFDAAVMASGRPQDEFVRATPLIDINGVIMAVHGYNTSLDMDLVHKLTGRRLQPLTARQSARLFADCDPGFQPPVGAAYDIP